MKVVAYKTCATDTVHVDAFYNNGGRIGFGHDLQLWLKRILETIEMTEQEKNRLMFLDLTTGDYLGVITFESGAFLNISQHNMHV